ncbi:hypothetical protein HMPREF0972_01786 [Actinomyces sp. oral taxon 848 str. F0332]|nr:hypothetical protein HMPREF0972_01786 [Actinomyces sp. oral taxon 848 str. F0332]
MRGRPWPRGCSHSPLHASKSRLRGRPQARNTVSGRTGHAVSGSHTWEVRRD